MKCGTKIYKTGYEERPNEEELKQSIYDPSTITDDVLNDLVLSDKSTITKTFNKFFGSKDPKIPYKSVKDKVGSLKYNNLKDKPFGDKVGSISNAEDLRAITIALSHLLSVQDSESHAADNVNLTDEQLNQVIDSNGLYRTSYSNIARVIGRNIIKTKGYRLVPTSDEGIRKTIAFETKIGEAAIALLPKNLVNIEENQVIVDRGFKKLNPKDEMNTKYNQGKVKLIKGVKTITVKDIVDKTLDDQDALDEAFAITSNLTAIKALIDPSNKTVTHEEVQPINEEAQDLTMHENDRDTLAQIQESPLIITEHAKEILSQIKDIVERDINITTKNTLGSLAKFISSGKGSPNMFGTIDADELEKIMLNDETGLEQEYGKSISKTIQFSRIFDSWDNIQNDIYYTFQTAIQNRAHVMEQDLSYQSDNFLSRHILGSSDNQILDTDEKKSYLIAYVMDETGLSLDEILKEGTNTQLDDYINARNNKQNGESSLGIMMWMSKKMDKGNSPIPKELKSVWELDSYLGVISDIRNGIHNNKPIETHFMPKPDATASGAVITVLQSLRYGEETEGLEGEITDVVNSLVDGKRTVNGKETSFNDMYTLATDDLKNKLDNKKSNGGKTRDLMLKSQYRTLEQIDAISEGINKVIPGSRDLMKLPFTKFIYGQTKRNNMIEISKEMASIMISNDAKELMSTLLDKTPEQLKKMSSTQRRKALIKELNRKDGVADLLVTIIDETTGDKLFARQAAELGSIYSLLEEAKYDDGSKYNNISIMPPLATLNFQDGTMSSPKAYAKNRKKYSTSLEKYFETVMDDKDGNFTTVKKRYGNVNSIKVLLQHMTDAAILYRSMRTLFNDDHIGYDSGLMLNHDAVGSTTEFAMDLEPEYKEQIMHVNAHYDFVEAALWELKFARSQVTDGSKLAKDMDKKISELESTLPKQIAYKKAQLDNKVIDSSFGVKPHILEEVNNTDLSSYAKELTKQSKPKKEKKSKEDTKPKSKQVKVDNSEPNKHDSIETIRRKSINKQIDELKVLPRTKARIRKMNELKQKLIHMDEKLDYSNLSKKEAYNEFKKILSLKNYEMDEQEKERRLNLLRKIKDAKTKGKIFDPEFTPEEIIKMEKIFGKEEFALLQSIVDDNKNDILLSASKGKFKQLADTQYDPDSGKVIVPSKFSKDIRESDTFESKSIEEQEANFKTLPKLDTFNRKRAFFEILSHELNHKTNYNYINDYLNSDEEGKNHSKYKEIKYIEDTIKRLRKELTIDDLNPKTSEGNRLLYALFGNERDATVEDVDFSTMLEFTSIMKNEPKFAEYIYNKAYPGETKSWTKKAIDILIKNINKLVKILSGNRDAITAKNLTKLSKLFGSKGNANTKEVLKAALDIAHLKAIHHELKSKGIPKDEYSDIPFFVDVVKDQYKGYASNSSDTVKEDFADSAADFVNTLDKKVSTMIDNSINLIQDNTIKNEKVKNSHRYLMDNSKIYRDTFNAVTDQWDNNTFISKMKIYLDLNKNFNRSEFNKLNTQSMLSEERKNQFEIDKKNSLYKKSKGLFNDTETAGLYSLLAEVPVANLNKNNILKDIFTGATTIDGLIDTLLNSNNLSKAQISFVKSRSKALAELYIDKKASSFASSPKDMSNEIKAVIEPLSALYAMKKIPNIDKLMRKIMSTKNHKEYVNDLLELSSAVKTLDDEIYENITYDIDNYSGNYNHQVFKDNIQIQMVTVDNVNAKLQENLGWKILGDRNPTKSKAGIIYRDAGDITRQSGLGTNIKINPNHTIQLPSSYDASTNNAINNIYDYGSKIVFTNQELDEMGMVRNPIDSLVKAYSHRMMIKETQSVRDTLINDFTFKVTRKNQAKLVQSIKDGTNDWYLKLDKGVTLDQLDPLIRNKYKLSEAKSDVNNFSENVTLIRKDAGDFIEGFNEVQIGKTGSNLNKAFSVVKKSILLQKIHWVVTSPVKLTMDTVSNAAYLMSRNVPITHLFTKTKRIADDMANLTKIRENLLHAEFRNRVNPTKANQLKVNKLEEQIKNHPMASAYFRGFVQSIAIDINNKNQHTASGIHKDIGSILTYLFRDDKGSLNIAGKAIDKISKFGLNGEDLLLKIANLTNENSGEASQAAAKMLTDIANNISEMKKEGQVENYIQEFMATPGTGLVTVGSALVQTPDVISKVILQEFLVDQSIRDFKIENNRRPNATELVAINEKASLDVVTSFIDYKMNVPKELRFLEQTGITSFISFWARIQKVMLVSLKENPVNAITTLLLNEFIFGDNGATIFDASIVEKLDAGSLIGSPTPGLDMILPMQLFDWTKFFRY